MWLNNLSIKRFFLLTIVSQLVLVSGLLAQAKDDSNSRTINDVNELPPTKPSPQSRRSGGTRGECDEQDNTITLVVPEDKKSLTNIPTATSSNLKFVWHMAQKSDLPVKFTIVERGRTIYIQEFSSLDSGLISLTLPESVKLEVGKRYRWTVSILCSFQRPSRNPYTQAWVEIVPVSSFLKEKENFSCDDYEKAEIWYDAISCNLDSRSEAKFLALLEQVGLADLPLGNPIIVNNLELIPWSGLVNNQE